MQKFNYSPPKIKDSTKLIDVLDEQGNRTIFNVYRFFAPPPLIWNNYFEGGVSLNRLIKNKIKL